MQANVFSQTFFVKQDGTGNGTSWENASGDLPGVLSKAQPGDEIWVAKGTYLPTNCQTCSPDDRSASFNIPNGVKLLGGFIGTESRLKQRDWKKHVTTLSGDIGQEGNADNSYTVVFTQNVSSQTVVDGFVISDGNADANVDPGHPYRSGGGWYNDGSGFGNQSSPFIANCIFRGNRAKGGGALFNNAEGGGTAPALINCVFIDNQATYGGGAIFIHGRNAISQPSIENCQFVNNQAAFGAGIFTACSNEDIEPLVDHCIFANNKAQHGSGLFYLGLGEVPKLRTSRFVSNQSQGGDEDIFVMKGTVIPDKLWATIEAGDETGL